MSQVITDSGPLASTGVLWQANVGQYDGLTVNIIENSGNTVLVETSPDNSSWTQVGNTTGKGRTFYAATTEYVRVRVSTYVAGTTMAEVVPTTVGPNDLLYDPIGVKGNVSTNYTPVLTAASSGTFTYSINSAKYRRSNGRIEVVLDFTINTVGTATGRIYVTLPVAAASVGSFVGSEIALHAVSAMAYHGAGSILEAFYYNGGSLFEAGARVILAGSYEPAA